MLVSGRVYFLGTAVLNTGFLKPVDSVKVKKSRVPFIERKGR